jgi:hypothetical protein
MEMATMSNGINFLSRPSIGRYPMMTRFIRVLAVILLTSCGGYYAAATSRIEIRQSGLLAIGGSVVEAVYWLDNERVLFVGAKPGVFEQLPDGRKPLKQFLMQWDTASGKTTTLAELGEYSGLCYDRGYVRYNFRIGDKVTVKAGPLGEESDITESVLRPGREHIRVNRITCREYDERAVHSKYGPGFLPLREEHGFWGGREDARQRKLSVYIRTANDKQEELFVRASGHPRWSEYAGGYVFGRLEDLFSSTKTTGQVSLLMPNGIAQVFVIPAGPWFAGSVGYGLSSEGPFMWSSAVDTYSNGDAGGYLLKDGKPDRFISGYIYAFGVSPDGCKIALNINRNYGSGRGPEMVMANVCKKGD